MFISQPPGTEQAVAAEESRTLTPTAKITYTRAASDQLIQVDSILFLPPKPLTAQGRGTGAYVLNAVIQANHIIF